MKHILILLAMFFFIGCQQETQIVENQSRHDGWNLEYFHKVKIQNEELYECVYGRYVGYRDGIIFSVLSNTACKEKL